MGSRWRGCLSRQRRSQRERLRDDEYRSGAPAFEIAEDPADFAMSVPNRVLILEGLRELRDRGKQDRVWLSSGPPEVSYFVEAVEQVFTDNGLWPDLEVNKPTGLSDAANACLRELSAAIERIKNKSGPRKLIDSPTMDEIRRIARECLRLFDSG